MNNNIPKKSVLKTLRILLVAPFVAGFITGMIVFMQPDGMMTMGLGAMVGVWMIAAVASYKALKSYFLPSDAAK